VGHGKGNASDDNHLYDRRKMLSGKDLCDSAVERPAESWHSFDISCHELAAKKWQLKELRYLTLSFLA
jgi:hypothetical protein